MAFFSEHILLDMINQYNIEALQNIYNIDSFASHYDFIVSPTKDKVKKQTKEKEPTCSSQARQVKKELVLKTLDMKQYKKYWHIENKKENNERSKLWRLNNPARFQELMKRHKDKRTTID